MFVAAFLADPTKVGLKRSRRVLMAEKPTIVENNRGRQVSRLGDKTKSVSVGLMDMDSAIFYYFENVIKPYIEENGEQVKVPIIYANPERWAAVQKQGFVRDQKKKVMAANNSFQAYRVSKRYNYSC